MKLLKPLTASDRKWLRRTRRILLVGLILFFLGLAVTQATTQGPNYPASLGPTAWTNSSNIYADDGACASTSITYALIQAKNFSFTIPYNLTVTGIKVEVKAGVSLGGMHLAANLEKPNDLPSASKSFTPQGGSCATAQWYTLDNINEWWHTDYPQGWTANWTSGDFNSFNFGVDIVSGGESGTWYVDAVRVTLTYGVPPTTTTTTTTTLPGVTFNLPDVPAAIGDALGIDATAGGLLLSFILLFMILVPLGMLTRSFWVILIVGFTFSGFLTAIQWLPVWIMIMLSLITALMLGSRLAGLTSRGGSEEGD